MSAVCEYCGHGPHTPAACPLVKSVEFFPDGSIKRVEKYESSSFGVPSKTYASGQPQGMTVRWSDPFQGKVDKEEPH